jgi:hypothetical protein
MADINGTGGNDTIQPFGNSLLMTLSGTIAEGTRPIINVLVNDAVVMQNLTITADPGAPQVVSVPVPAGTAVSSVSIQYTNDAQAGGTGEDRNVLVSSVNLNGDSLINGNTLPVSTVSYTRLVGDGVVFDTLDGAQWFEATSGQPLMKWGGTLTLSGPAVTGATATAGGNLSVDGGGGIDTLMLDGVRSDFSIAQTSTGYTVNRLSGGETLALANVERLHFQSGVSHALDMSGNAGTATEIISALFGARGVAIPEFVGIGISLLDQGMDPLQLTALAISTPVFQQLAGSSSNADFVKLVYQNIVGTAPSQETVTQLAGILDSGAATQASLGLAAAELSLNQAHLVGVMQTGIDYV